MCFYFYIFLIKKAYLLKVLLRTNLRVFCCCCFLGGDIGKQNNDSHLWCKAGIPVPVWLGLPPGKQEGTSSLEDKHQKVAAGNTTHFENYNHGHSSVCAALTFIFVSRFFCGPQHPRYIQEIKSEHLNLVKLWINLLVKSGLWIKVEFMVALLDEITLEKIECDPKSQPTATGYSWDQHDRLIWLFQRTSFEDALKR